MGYGDLSTCGVGVKDDELSIVDADGTGVCNGSTAVQGLLMLIGCHGVDLHGRQAMGSRAGAGEGSAGEAVSCGECVLIVRRCRPVARGCAGPERRSR
jgi:hypothetical protein